MALPKEKGVKVIIAEGKTVMPGLIDSHVHIYTDGESSEFYFLPIKNNHLNFAMKLIPRLKHTLEMGIATLRDGGSGWNWLEVALRDAINRGDIIGRDISLQVIISRLPGDMVIPPHGLQIFLYIQSNPQYIVMVLTSGEKRLV